MSKDIKVYCCTESHFDEILRLLEEKDAKIDDYEKKLKEKDEIIHFYENIVELLARYASHSYDSDVAKVGAYTFEQCKDIFGLK